MFLSAFAPENLVSRDGFGGPVPRQPAHLHNTTAESGTYLLRGSSRVPRRRPFIYVNHHTSSCQCRAYRVTQLRTDDVRCQELAGPGPGNLKVVPDPVLPWQVPMDRLICAYLSNTYYWYEVGMLKVPAY